MVAKPTFYYITGGLFTKVFYSTASSGGLFLLKLQQNCCNRQLQQSIYHYTLLYSLLLRHTQLVIVALLRHKFIVRAGFGNALIADEHYLVAVLDC